MTFDARKQAMQLLLAHGLDAAAWREDEFRAALQSAFDAGRSAGRDEALREAEEVAAVANGGHGGLDAGCLCKMCNLRRAIARLRARTPKGTP